MVGRRVPERGLHSLQSPAQERRDRSHPARAQQGVRLFLRQPEAGLLGGREAQPPDFRPPGARGGLLDEEKQHRSTHGSRQDHRPRHGQRDGCRRQGGTAQNQEYHRGHRRAHGHDPRRSGGREPHPDLPGSYFARQAALLRGHHRRGRHRRGVRHRVEFLRRGRHHRRDAAARGAAGRRGDQRRAVQGAGQARHQDSHRHKGGSRCKPQTRGKPPHLRGKPPHPRG